MTHKTLDPRKLLGFRLVVGDKGTAALAAKQGAKLGAKLGTKLGVKLGIKGGSEAASSTPR